MAAYCTITADYRTASTRVGEQQLEEDCDIVRLDLHMILTVELKQDNERSKIDYASV